MKFKILSYLLIIVSLAKSVEGVTYIATNPQEIQNYTNLLQAGDTLLVQAGAYNMSSWYIQNRVGVANDWIVITTLGGNVIITGTALQNIVNMNNCSFLKFGGFELTCTGQYDGIDGVKFNAGTKSNHIIIHDCYIRDITGVGLNSKADTASFIELRHNHIFNAAEGMYLGSHDGVCIVINSIVDNNWVHNTNVSYGDGIQIKRSSYNNIIQDNVVYNINDGGIVLYKTDKPDTGYNNIVRRNVIWRANEGIFAVGGVDIENNVVFDCPYGINTRNYSSWGMENLCIFNNTSYHCSVTCMRCDDWNIATDVMRFINNAAYRDSLNQSAFQAPEGIGNATVMNNYYYGTSELPNATLGNQPQNEFLNATVVPGVVNLYARSTSALINSGTGNYGAPLDDFNLLSRPFGSNWDVGAYEWSQNTNPGWQIQEGFKQINIGVSETKPIEVNANYVYCLIGGKIIFKNLCPTVTIKIYNVSGKLVHNSGSIFKNYYEWKTIDIPCGIYYYTLESPGRNSLQGKIIVVR